MNNNENSINQPYEEIETEETITRYFNKNSKGRNVLPEKKSLDRSESKVDPTNDHFEDLYAKFTKLNTVMAELTKKFKEINLAKTQVEKVLPPFENDFVANDFCYKKKLLTNPDELKRDIKNSNSHINLESQIDQRELKSSRVIYDGSRKYPFACPSVEAGLLMKSKKLLVGLIDKELQRVESNRKTLPSESGIVNVTALNVNNKTLKMKCMDKITEELSVLKDLE